MTRKFGPGLRADAQHFASNLGRRNLGQRLGEDEDHAGGGARDAGVAMHQQMRVLRRLGGEVAPEGEKLPDVAGIRGDHARRFLDDVVKAEFKPRVLAERAERVGHRPAGIEDRQHVADAGLVVVGQFVDAAYGDAEGGDRGHDDFYNGCRAG